ncbi:MAG: DUF3131 domain-containing protein [Anaerolineae bacterium]|nr:DUF3131 domain-containing protein [Phycisphaerae bacterium]
METRTLLASAVKSALGQVRPTPNLSTLNAVALALDVAQTTVLITEGVGAVQTIRLRLTASPPSPVTINLSRISGDTDISVLDTSVVINSSNWRAEKYIRLQAASDADATNGVATIRATASGLSPLDIIATEKDDDGAQGIELSSAAVSIPEDRTTTFRARLTARPASNVTIQTARAGGDSDLEVEAHSAITFSPTNWDRWQWISIASKSDADTANGSATFNVTSPGMATQTVTGTEADSTSTPAIHNVLVDDYQVLASSGFGLDRLGANRGQIASAGATVDFLRGSVNAQITSAGGFAGVFSSLNHDSSEHLQLNAQAILPSQIRPEYQYRITAVTADILDGQGTFQLELKNAANAIVWSGSVALTGGPTAIRLTVPNTVGNVELLNWVVTGPAGSFAKVDSVKLEVAGPQIGYLEEFLWPYASLLANYNAATGLVRDSSSFVTGAFDGINGTGALAAATAMAEKLGVISTASAQQIVSKITTTLLDLQANASFNGVLPHFLKNTANGPRIIPGSEFSSIDTSIAFLFTLLSSQALSLPTAPLEQAIDNVNWQALKLPNGQVSHGYTDTGTRLPQGWDYFGGESLLTALTYAAAEGSLPSIPNINVANPATFNGSGFIDEMLWLVMSPVGKDAYGPDWDVFRTVASNRQVQYYDTQPAPLFGASAGEAPILAQTTSGYDAFGVGGAIANNDGSAVFVAPVQTPHYAGMVWSLQPDSSERMFDYLTQNGMLTPLNNVESSVAQTWSGQIENSWNSLRGSWNLGLQVLGVGKGLLQHVGVNPLSNAAETNTYIAAARQKISAATQNLTLSNKAAIIDAPRTFDSINISGASGDMIIRDGGFNTLRSKSLSITTSGVLDLNDNDMILDYTGGSQLAAIQSLINSARSGGTWSGTGLTSTSAKNANPKNRTLGAMEATDYQSIYGPGATFNGQAIDASTVLVKFTYYGDADFNDVVDFDDYSRTDGGFNDGRTGWLNGDFDGNGIVDFDDYSLIDQAFNTQS